MNETILIIGTGNMGSALIGGMINSKKFFPEQILVYDIDINKSKELIDKYGIKSGEDLNDLLVKADIIILAVKPNIIEKVTEDIKKCINSEKIVISIAVGVSINKFKEILGKDSKVVRVMPNTPALIREGMSAVSVCKNITEDDKKTIEKIFKSVGEMEYIPEKLMNSVIALSGSSPAYVFMFIEAMADAAVNDGVPRDLAYKMASQTVMGSAKMVLQSGTHPGVLKDQVCSPGGTTIEAVRTLEEKGFRSAVMEAMSVCTKKAIQISKGEK